MNVPVELKQKYLTRRIQDIQKVRESLEQDDYSLALKIGHQVKGNASTFEFGHIAPLGIEIEMAAKVKDKPTIILLVQKLENAIFRESQILNKIFHKTPFLTQASEA